MFLKFRMLIYLILEKKNSLPMGIGDWGLGIGDWGLGPVPNPPVPNPHPPHPP